MHRAHDGELLQAPRVKVLDELVVLEQVLDVGRGGVLEAVTPGHVEHGVRATHLLVDVRIA